MKKLLTITLISILALSGCSWFGGREVGNVENNQPTEVNADTVLDNQIYGAAVDTKDATKCEELSDESKKEECKKVVEAIVLTEQAKTEMDDDYCEDIEIDKYKENCEALVEMKTNENKMEIERQEKSLERTGIEQEAVDKKDHTICEKIEDEATMYSCKKNVIINEAIQTGDESVCSKFEKEEYIEECIFELQLLGELED